MSKNESMLLDELHIEGIGLVKNGVMVEHTQFAKGKVEAIIKLGEFGYLMQINFEHYGTKKLVPEYPELKLYDTASVSLMTKIKKLFR